MSWQINCVFPFYFDAGFSRHLFLCAIFVAGAEWQRLRLPFAALCVFPAAAEKRETLRGAGITFPKAAALLAPGIYIICE